MTDICQAQVSDQGIPEPKIDKCFQLLDDNRRYYNHLNDSVFLIDNHDDWVVYFKHRSIKKQQIFLANKEIIQVLHNYFAQGPEKLGLGAYLRLYTGLKKLNTNQTIDPYFGSKICDVLLDYYDSGYCPPYLNYAGNVSVLKGNYLYEMSLQRRDLNHLHESYQFFLRPLREDRSANPDYLESKTLALCNLMETQFVFSKLMSVREYNQIVDSLRALLPKKEVQRFFSKDDFDAIVQAVKTADERLIQDVYLVDETILQKEYTDSLMRALVERNMKNPNLSFASYSRTMMMRVLLGQIQARDILNGTTRQYNKLRRQIRTQRFSNLEFKQILVPYLIVLKLSDQSEFSFAHKRKWAKRLGEDIVLAFQRRKDQQASNSFVRYVNAFITNPHMLKYLTDKERIYFLDEMNVATQVTTYAHSLHVSMIADKILDAVLRYQPELLVGALGDMQITKILDNAKKYSHYMRGAALYHDIGKNAIVSVVNNDFRPLYDEEFEIIKTHPRLGADLLDFIPSLHDLYHDTTLGHHKWYNGKGGYPQDFDNTQSSKRVLIDILTLADCMQAATENVGRNYRGDKPFEKVLDEFRRDKGTRYNPDLVDLINTHPDLVEDLKDLVTDTWVDIYYDIYKMFLRKDVAYRLKTKNLHRKR